MIEEGLKEDLRVDILGRLKAVDILGMRSDALLRSIKKDSRYAQLVLSDLQAQVLQMAKHGWVKVETLGLNAGVSNYTLTQKGHDFCYEQGIEG